MKTYCKHADPTDLQIIERYVFEAMSDKLQRKDYSEFVSKYCPISGKEIRKRARDAITWYPELEQAVALISREIAAQIRARRSFRRAWNGDRRLITQYRVGAYYGYFKAAKIHRLRPARRTDPACIGIESTQRQAGIIIGTAMRRDLSCAA